MQLSGVCVLTSGEQWRRGGKAGGAVRTVTYQKCTRDLYLHREKAHSPQNQRAEDMQRVELLCEVVMDTLVRQPLPW